MKLLIFFLLKHGLYNDIKEGTLPTYRYSETNLMNFLLNLLRTSCTLPRLAVAQSG
jgi:hypothetical protein